MLFLKKSKIRYNVCNEMFLDLISEQNLLVLFHCDLHLNTTHYRTTMVSDWESVVRYLLCQICFMVFRLFERLKLKNGQTSSWSELDSENK